MFAMDGRRRGYDVVGGSDTLMVSHVCWVCVRIVAVLVGIG